MNPFGGLLRLLRRPERRVPPVHGRRRWPSSSSSRTRTSLTGHLRRRRDRPGGRRLRATCRLTSTGLLLVAIGLVLFALEPAIPSHGLLTIGGVDRVRRSAASRLYSQADQFGPAVRVAAPLLVVAAVTAAAFGLLIAPAAIRTREMAGPRRPAAGRRRRRARSARSAGRSSRSGSIYAEGEEWSARAADDRPLPRGTPVQVIGSDGLTVVVEPEPSGLG